MALSLSLSLWRDGRREIENQSGRRGGRPARGQTAGAGSASPRWSGLKSALLLVRQKNKIINSMFQCCKFLIFKLRFSNN